MLSYTKPSVIVMLLLGFSAGLPFLLVFSTLTAWLSDYGVSKSMIGFFGWVGMIYSIKFFWSPIVDRLKLPLLSRLLGQRRSWILVGQLMIVGGLLVISSINPAVNLASVAMCALIIAFGSSTQDIAIDAYRIEVIEQRYQGAMSAAYVFGYRLALLVAGAGSLLIADNFDWPTAYQAMALCMLVGVITVLMAKRPDNEAEPGALLEQHQHRPALIRFQYWLRGAIVEPFVDFYRRYRHIAVKVLLLVALYRLSDIVMGVMANPFYLDLGFTKSEIATVAKAFGFFMTIAGSFFCGVMVARYGVYKPLVLGAIMVAATNLLFVLLAQTGNDMRLLVLAISADNLSGGIASTAFLAYLAGLTNKSYTATQYALFSSLMTLPGKFFSGFSGVLVDGFGYPMFFFVAAILGIPAIILSMYVLRRAN